MSASASATSSCDLCQSHGTALVEEQEFEEAVESESESDDDMPVARAHESDPESGVESGAESEFDEE